MGIEPNTFIARSFNDELDEKLIDLVKKYPILYGGGGHKVKGGRDHLWKKIALKLDKNVLECKTRWRTIRNSYKRIQDKRKARQEKGLKSYKTSKYNTDNLKFLDGKFRDKKKTPNIEFTDSSDDEEEDHEVVKIPEAFEAEVFEGDTQNIAEDYFCSPLAIRVNNSEDELGSKESLSNIISIKNTNLSTSDFEEFPKIELKRISVKENMFENSEIDKSKIILEDFVEKQTPAFSEHPIETFFACMAKTVMEFPPHLIAETRLKVCQVVTEIELKALNK